PHFEVGTSIADRPQERFGGVPAPAVLLVDLEIADPFVVAAVEVLGVRDARLLRGLAERVQDVPAQPLTLDPPLAAGAVRRVGALVVVLVLLERGQALRPAPARIAGELRPAVVVAR